MYFKTNIKPLSRLNKTNKINYSIITINAMAMQNNTTVIRTYYERIRTYKLTNYKTNKQSYEYTKQSNRMG
jgi:hypothetical protein